MANKVKVLVVGAAFSADLHMDGYARCTDVAKIVAICDKATERANDIIKRYGLEDVEVYDDAYKAIDSVDCDVVDICLPNFMLSQKVKMLLQKNLLQQHWKMLKKC